MMDVTVKNSSISNSLIEIDLGGSDKLVVSVEYDTDRFTNVLVLWASPAKVTGHRDAIRDRQVHTLLRTRLDQVEGEVISR